MEDLSQLASLGLPALGGSQENPSWNRSLRELKIASDSLWTQSTPGVLADPASNPLLGSRHLPELDRIQGGDSCPTTKTAENDFLCWEEANRKHELQILKDIITKVSVHTQKRSEELYERREEEDWNKKRDLWMKELVGTRNLGGSESQAHGTLLLENSVGTKRPMTASLSKNLITDRSVDPGFIAAHLEIIKRKRKNANFEVASELANIAGSSTTISPGNACYATALRLVAGISRRHFSPIEGALATLEQFSQQFADHLVGRLRKVDSQNQPLAIYRSPNANTVSSFVAVELGDSAESALWPSLYYCLRIGDAVAAKEVFESTPAANENENTTAAIGKILSHLAQRQGLGPSMWEASGPLVLPRQEFLTLAEVFGMSKTSPNLYRSGVLALLGGEDLPTANAVGLCTIEDYLFGLLWKGLQSDNPVFELENAGRTIRNFGAAYFHDKDSGGWSYCLPLLASQQYRTALSYLLQAGGQMGLLQATHLGLLLERSCAELADLGESDHQSTNGLLGSLLVDYSNWLHGVRGPVDALVYLQCIPNKNLVVDQVSALILQTEDVHILAGQCSNELKRGKGALDDYFAPADVSLLLKQAAEKCYMGATDRVRQMKAATLAMVAGDFKLLVEMLGVFISPGMDVRNEDKRFWYEQSKNFHATHLTKSTHVMNVLEQNGHLPTVETFKAMMQLYEFFCCIAAGQFLNAWKILDGLAILPQSMSQIGEKSIRYKGLDPILQQKVPGIMVAAMHSYRHEHARLKAMLHTGSENTIQSAMSDLKSKASVNLAFAGVISSVTQAQLEEMARLEASII